MNEHNKQELKNIPPFAGLPEQARQYLQARIRRYDFSPGDSIINPGKRGAFFAIIARGTVVLQEASGELITLKTGGMFGEGMLRYGVPSSFSARALSDTSLWVIKRTDWIIAKDFTLSIEKKRPSIESKLYSNLIRWMGRCLIFLIFLTTTIIILGPTLLNFTHEMVTSTAIQAGRLDLAMEYIEFALIAQPKSARLYDYFGYLLFLQEKPVEAQIILEKAVILDNTLASAHNNLGVILLQQGKISEAIIHLEDAINLDPTSTDAYLNLGNALSEAMNYDSALLNYQKSYELNPTQIEARAKWASIALEIGEIAAAKEVWDEILLDEPHNFIANRGLGTIEALRENYVLALPYLQTASLTKPEDATTHFYLGVVWQALGNMENSIAEFEAVLVYSKDADMIHRTKQHLEKTKD